MSGQWAAGRRVWIGGVKKGCAENRLRRHFEHFGTIAECETGFTGIAFIVFESAAAAAEMCKQLNGTTEFEGRTCTVKIASDKGYAEAIRRRTEEASRQASTNNYQNGQYSDAKSKRGKTQQAYPMRVPPPPPPPPPGRRAVRRGAGMGAGPMRKRKRRWVETNSQRVVEDRSETEGQLDDDAKDAEDAGSSPGRATRTEVSPSAMRPSPTPHDRRRFRCRSRSQGSRSRRRYSSASLSRSPFSRRRCSSVGSATRVSRVTRSNSSVSASSFDGRDGVRGAAAKAAVHLTNSLPLDKATQQEPSPGAAATPTAQGDAVESTEAGHAAAACEQAAAASDGAAPQAQAKEPTSPVRESKPRDTAQPQSASPANGKAPEASREAANATAVLTLPPPPHLDSPAPAEAVSPKPACKHEEATANVIAVEALARGAAVMGMAPAGVEPAVVAKVVKEEVSVHAPAVVTVEPAPVPGMIVEAGKHAGSIWHAAGENVPPPVIAAGGDLVDICLIHKGNKKLVTHLSTTKVREVIELQPSLVQALKKPVVALDARGFEVGKDIPVGFLMHRADVGDDGVRLLELTLEADKWCE